MQSIAEGELRELILRFKRVAEFGWPEVTEAVPSESREELLNDWLQFQWEMLVEWPLRIRDGELTLGFYGDGADGASSHIREISQHTHWVCCRPLQGDELPLLLDGTLIRFPETGLQFEKFAQCEAGQWTIDAPPWDSVVLYGDEIQEFQVPLAFKIEDVKFCLQRVKSKS